MNHLEFAASESFVSNKTKSWNNFVARVEKALGHDLDGDQARDGYSMDHAYDMWNSGSTLEMALADIQRRKTNREG